MKNLYIKILAKITSLSAATISMLFAITFLLATNLATLFTASAFDLFSSALKHITPSSWHKNSYSNKYAQKSKDYQAMKKARNSLVDKNQKLKDSNKNLIASKRKLDLENKRLQRNSIHSSQLKNKVNNVSRKIKNRMGQLAGKTIIEAPLESIPFYGVAVIATSATIELSYACQTMKDIHSLEEDFFPDRKFDNTVCGMKAPTIDQMKSAWYKQVGKIQKAFIEWYKSL